MYENKIQTTIGSIVTIYGQEKIKIKQAPVV
jgi:hypothetical protein